MSLSTLRLSPAPSQSFAPEAVYISAHALERYVERRHTTSKAAEFGIRRLLGRAASRPLPAVKWTQRHGATRRFLIGEFILIMDEDCSRLVTMWRAKRRGQ